MKFIFVLSDVDVDYIFLCFYVLILNIFFINKTLTHQGVLVKYSNTYIIFIQKSLKTSRHLKHSSFELCYVLVFFLIIKKMNAGLFEIVSFKNITE